MMRKVSIVLLLVGLALSNAACLVVLGAKDRISHRHVVEIDGELYVVDTESLRIRRIETEFTVDEETAADVEVDED